MKPQVDCKFCNQKYKLRSKWGEDRHGQARHLKWIVCDTCDVNSYFDNELNLIKLVYHIRQPGFIWLSMNLVEQHTTIGFENKNEQGSQFLELAGCWPDTLPKESFKLTQRLMKLAAFA